MLAAVIQLSSQDDVPKNLARAMLLVGEAARAGAQVVALPENFAFARSPRSSTARGRSSPR
jgi:nitrilase